MWCDICVHGQRASKLILFNDCDGFCRHSNLPNLSASARMKEKYLLKTFAWMSANDCV